MVIMTYTALHVRSQSGGSEFSSAEFNLLHSRNHNSHLYCEWMGSRVPLWRWASLQKWSVQHFNQANMVNCADRSPSSLKKKEAHDSWIFLPASDQLWEHEKQILLVWLSKIELFSHDFSHVKEIMHSFINIICQTVRWQPNVVIHSY